MHDAAILGVTVDRNDTPAKWEYPRPSYYVKHFKSAGTKLLHLAGKIGDVQAYVTVPVFRGESYREANRRRSYQGQMERNPQRPRNPWKKKPKLEEIKETFIDG